jgi:hypothetical protein
MPVSERLIESKSRTAHRIEPTRSDRLARCRATPVVWTFPAPTRWSCRRSQLGSASDAVLRENQYFGPVLLPDRACRALVILTMRRVSLPWLNLIRLVRVPDLLRALLSLLSLSR